MPRYLYQCSNITCNRFEGYVYRIGQQPTEMRCPHCLSGTMGRIFTAPRLITQPHHLRDVNKLYSSATDERCKHDSKDERHAAIRADERKYVADRESWNKTAETGPDPYEGQPDLFDYAAAGYEIPTIAELKREGVL